MRLCALLGLLFLTVFDSSECLQTVVRPDKGSTVTVSTELPADQCAVCRVSGVNDTETSCTSSLSLVPEEEVKLLFNCSQPVEQSYTVVIAYTIECTKDTCVPNTVEIQPSILAELPRTFTWELKAPEKIVVGLGLLGDGVKETSDPCTNGLQYSVATSKTNGQDVTKYCQGGSVTRFELPNEAVVSLRVEPKAQVASVVFVASAGPLKGRTMVVSVNSSTTVDVIRSPGEPECEVCSVDGSTRDCSPTEKTLTNVKNLSLEFSCQKPQDVYSVQMKTAIECTQTSCTPAAGEFDLFKDFKRSLKWDISVPERTALTLDFPGGLKEITGAETCQDGPKYVVSTTKSDGTIKANSYCKGGTGSHLELLRATTVTADVPKDGELDSTVFNVKTAPRGGRMMLVMPELDTTIKIARVTDEPDCSVCVNEASNQKCDTKELTLRDPTNTSVEFTCPQPQEVFNVEIVRDIDCTEVSCSGDIVQAESSLFPDFNRTFIWYLKVVSSRAFQLDFPEPGMRQISNEETCPDGHTYSFLLYLRSGPATIGTFCKGGVVTTVMARYRGGVFLKVPGNRKLDPVDYKLTVGPQTDMSAIVKVNLPRGVSATEFITPNYPRDFPDNEQMQWNFTVPGMHNYTIRFIDYTAPECLMNEIEVQYHTKFKTEIRQTLIDPQPEHQQGNFNMVLKNCKTNTTLKGLSLKYKVSVMRSGHPVLCSVDLTKQQGVSLQIEKVGSDPYCEMRIDSKVEKKINVAAGTRASLSFLDCPKEDVRLTASKVIGCHSVASCSGTLLMVPKLASCLPMPLHSFTWNISIPLDGTMDLTSPSGTLQQSLPGQECNRSAPLHVAEEDGVSIGDFCPNGVIQRIQVHANVTVTAPAQLFSKSRGPFLNVSLSEEIPETIIYRVSPKTSSPTLLATPNWPEGMRPSSTVSYIVSLPSRYQAALQFVNVTQPKCLDRHTAIKVKMLGHEEEIMSRREDEKAEDELLVPQSFYLNMSNCIPEEGQFGAVAKIVLQKKANLLAIILGVIGALLLIAIVVAAVLIIKKKKRDKMNKESSIYIGKGSFFRPGDRHFIKTRSDNESHVYDSIDETMVYGHLLGDSSYSGSSQDHYKGMQVDSYQTFTGPTDAGLPVIREPDNEPVMDQLDPSQSFLPPRPRTPINRQDSLGFQDSRMVDNELYTFKSTGDINTIRLSGADLEPQPPLTEESL